MTPTRTTVVQLFSALRGRVVGPAGAPMSRHIVTLVALALVAIAAPASAAAPFFLVYGVPPDSDPVDPSGLPQDGSGMPQIPPEPIPVGAQSVDVDVRFNNWGPDLETSTGTPCDPVAADGSDVTGYEVCGWHLLFVAEGLEILDFSPATGVKHFLTDDPAGDKLSVTGGTPLTPPTGEVPIGTVSLRATGPNQTLQARPGSEAIAFVAANLATRTAPVAIVASSSNTCGNNNVESYEECDFGNAVSGDGDGCYRNCEDEFEVQLGGAATASGDVQIEIETVPLVISTSNGETAEQVAEKIVDVVNANPDLIAGAVTSEQVGTPADRVVTDGQIASATSNTPGLTIDVIDVPEPSQWLMLAAGVTFLATAGRRRFSP